MHRKKCTFVMECLDCPLPVVNHMTHEPHLTPYAALGTIALTPTKVLLVNVEGNKKNQPFLFEYFK